MKKTCVILLIFCLGSTGLFARDPGYYGVSAGGSAVVPLSGLADLYKSAPSLKIGVGFFLENGWYMEGQVDLCRLDRSNLTGYAKENVTVSLEYGGMMFTGHKPLIRSNSWNIQFIAGMGPFYWKGIRSEIVQNDSLGIPHIPKRTLEEWNMAFQAGAGVEYFITSSLALELSSVYRLMIGSLWPTMQEHILIEQVNGFQMAHVNLRLRYYF
ncbi:TPA: hypothetical protein DCG86_09360 [Candidatus Marinimicrobia bacterium]|nr:MAG: hypothetical protein XE04_0261 [Marinimicrobia bacterium 46_43]HAE88211.1 hypothetical protein [Candidatus Neomarinimicrobiota bacterium]HBY17850.1 hypothetical protein [Candidatus Neomarinimicrobiota bacterium]